MFVVCKIRNICSQKVKLKRTMWNISLTFMTSNGMIVIYTMKVKSREKVYVSNIFLNIFKTKLDIDKIFPQLFQKHFAASSTKLLQFSIYIEKQTINVSLIVFVKVNEAIYEKKLPFWPDGIHFDSFNSSDCTAD